MKTLMLTGMNGTLAPVVAKCFVEQGWQVEAWDRTLVDPADTQACLAHWHKIKPDAVCHLAMGSEDWAAWLSQQTAQTQTPYLFTSTAMVFDASSPGPYSIESPRTAKDEYGLYKIRCEDRIWQQNPNAMIARLGWQIGLERGGNNMLEYLYQQMEQHGHIAASRQWYPACSLMTVSAKAIYKLMNRNEPGLYHLDSNVNDKLNFYDLLKAIQAKLNYHQWLVIGNDDYVHDQRLLDPRLSIPSLSDCLGLDIETPPT